MKAKGPKTSPFRYLDGLAPFMSNSHSSKPHCRSPSLQAVLVLLNSPALQPLLPEVLALSEPVPPEVLAVLSEFVPEMTEAEASVLEAPPSPLGAAVGAGRAGVVLLVVVTLRVPVVLVDVQDLVAVVVAVMVAVVVAVVVAVMVALVRVVAVLVEVVCVEDEEVMLVRVAEEDVLVVLVLVRDVVALLVVVVEDFDTVVVEVTEIVEVTVEDLEVVLEVVCEVVLVLVELRELLLLLVLLRVLVVVVVVVGNPPSKTRLQFPPGAPTAAVKGPAWLSQMLTDCPKKSPADALLQVSFSWKLQTPPNCARM